MWALPKLIPTTMGFLSLINMDGVFLFHKKKESELPNMGNISRDSSQVDPTRNVSKPSAKNFSS